MRRPVCGCPGEPGRIGSPGRLEMRDRAAWSKLGNAVSIATVPMFARGPVMPRSRNIFPTPCAMRALACRLGHERGPRRSRDAGTSATSRARSAGRRPCRPTRRSCGLTLRIAANAMSAIPARRAPRSIRADVARPVAIPRSCRGHPDGGDQAPRDDEVLGEYGKALADAGDLAQAKDVLTRAYTPDNPRWM